MPFDSEDSPPRFRPFRRRHRDASPRRSIWAGQQEPVETISETIESLRAQPNVVHTEVDRCGTTTIFRVTGLLTIKTRTQVLQEAIPLIVNANQFVLDLRGVDGMDSLGLAAVYEMRGALDASRKLRVVPSLVVRVGLQHASRMKTVVLYDSVEEAVKERM